MKQGEVCKLTDGEKRSDKEHPYLEVKYLRGTNEKHLVSEGKFIKSGTRIILVDGENSGEVFTVSEDGYMGSTFKALEIKGIEEKYLLFFINMNKELYKNNKKGSAIPHLNKELFRSIEIPLPPLAEQKHIVTRIETIFTQIDKIAAEAQTTVSLYEHFKAKLLQMAFSGKLKIDNGEFTIDNWEETTLGGCCKIGSGGTPSKSHPEYYENGNIPWLNTGEIDWVDITSTEKFITQTGLDNSSAKLYPAESVVVAMYGMGITRGKAAILKISATTNQAVCVLQPNEKLNNRFLFYYFMCNYWNIREKAIGGNQLNLSAKLISEFKIYLPPINYQLSIVNYLDTVLAKARTVHDEATELLEQIPKLKKAVLVKAFSGKL